MATQKDYGLPDIATRIDLGRKNRMLIEIRERIENILLGLKDLEPLPTLELIRRLDPILGHLIEADRAAHPWDNGYD